MNVGLRMLLVAALSSTLAASAQQATATDQLGSLAGIVTDNSGGVIPGARIVALLGLDQRSAITDISGRYKLEGLPVGTYAVGASLIGFVTRRAEIQIVAGQQAIWNATLVVRSGFASEPPSGIDPTDPALALGVYEAVLRHVYKGSVPAAPIVRATSLIQPFDELEWPARLAAVPLTLQKASSTPEARRPVTLRAESLPTGARLVESIKNTDLPYTAFSRVFATDDRLGALVVFTHVCGSLCAESTMAWLGREASSAQWTIRATYTFMVSAPEPSMSAHRTNRLYRLLTETSARRSDALRRRIGVSSTSPL